MLFVTLHSLLGGACCFRQVPDYRELIKHPMDFATIRRKVDLQAYRTVDEVAADFQLMISNCMTYNAKTTVFYRAAVKLKNQVRRLLVRAVLFHLLNAVVTVFCSQLTVSYSVLFCYYLQSSVKQHLYLMAETWQRVCNPRISCHSYCTQYAWLLSSLCYLSLS